MARFFQAFDDEGFASGATPYDEHWGRFLSTHIIVPVRIGGLLTQAIVDTGASWCIFDPEIIRQIGFQEAEWYDADQTMLPIRGQYMSGKLLNLPVSLIAEYGASLEINATIFVPEWNPEVSWPNPNFVGLDGLLNAMKYAVDSTEKMFYFGVA